MPDDLNNIEDGDTVHPQDAVRRFANVAKNFTKVVTRVDNLAGAIPPGPPNDQTLVASLKSIQESVAHINATVTGILQRQA